MKLIFSLIFISFLTFTSYAQEPSYEYGSSSELKGVTKIFINTGTDFEGHSDIVKEIEKSKKKNSGSAISRLSIVDDPSEAEVILNFGAITNKYLLNVMTMPPTAEGGATFTNPTYGNSTVGKGLVVRIINAERIRILFDFSDTRTLRFEKKPSTNFARRFIKEYLGANSGEEETKN